MTIKEYFSQDLMKETRKSLRWYFLLIGVGGLYISLKNLVYPVAAPSIFEVATLLFGMFSCVGWLYFGYALPVYLQPKRVQTLKNFIHLAAIVGITEGFVTDVADLRFLGKWEPLGFIVGLYIACRFWRYLIRSVDHLLGKKR